MSLTTYLNERIIELSFTDSSHNDYKFQYMGTFINKNMTHATECISKAMFGTNLVFLTFGCNPPLTPIDLVWNL